MIYHRCDRYCFDGIANLLEVYQKQTHSIGFLLDLFEWRTSCQQQEHVGMLIARGKDLLTVDHVMIALAASEGLDPGSFGTGVGLRDAERLQPQLSRCDPRQVALFLL